MKNRTKFAAVLGAAAINIGSVSRATAAAQSVPISKVSHIHGIVVDPTDSARLYLATHSGVWRTSADGTATQVSGNDNDYMGFTPHPNEKGVFFGSGHPKGGGNVGFITSRDDGKSWKQISPGENGPADFHALTISAANPSVLYGLYGGIQASQDGGETWISAGAPPAGKPSSLVEVAPDGTVYTFILGSGLLKMSKGVGDWLPVANGFDDQILLHLAVDPSDPARIFAVTQKSLILASSESGQTWKALQP